ncbi:hypothetical protein OS493_016669 [Desmophyllum pertusum]|uniref:G-protein coupled receptors family 1 profile domain-containing protein n=1 Tax=Desmophyllum pertusum TaxID=174260 RepID=A0A9W9ZDI9_9CNID|nr:hypothetical protein OS493_016669 [Desmophyllum pertusum]
MNLTEESATESSMYTEHLAFKVTKIFLYVVILILSSVGNTMVVIIICRFKHMKSTPGNLFIVNLALCDLLTPLISIPLEMALVENSFTWDLGLPLCKLLPPAATFFATSSSLTLAAISLDRYRTLMHPFKQRLDARTVKMVIAFVHCCSGILIAPHIVTLELSPTPTVQCIENWPNKFLSKMYTFVLFLGQYALPLAFMAAMYIFAARGLFVSTRRARSLSFSSATSTGKRNGSLKPVLSPREASSHTDTLERHFRQNSEHNAQVTKVFIAIVVVFAVFTLPIEVLWIWAEFAGGTNHRLYPTIAVICRLFTYANSCLNPIIFYKFSRDFHRGFLAFFRFPSSCRDDSAFTSANSAASAATGKTSPTWLTPRGSLQSTPRLSFQSTSCHSVYFADQVKIPHDNKVEHNLNTPRSNSDSHCQFPSVEMLNRSYEEADQTKDIANYVSADPFLHTNVTSSECISTDNNCNISIKVLFYECDLTIELDKLESLLVLPQTDC